MVHESLASVTFSLASRPALPLPGRVLLTRPSHFQVHYVINPHMAGNVGSVDTARAATQWQQLADAYRSCGVDVHEIPGTVGQPDMVFCANQTLPYMRPDSGERGVVLSRMDAPQRAGEVAHYSRWFAELGYAERSLPDDLSLSFEGMGDAIWHPGRYLLWGGFGFRTDQEAYQHIARSLDVEVLALRLDDPDFYHLDTCLCALDEKTALIYPGAFDSDGLALIRRFFDRVLEAPEREARTLFACNAHCPDGSHVLIQRGCSDTCEALAAYGYRPVELDTDEFLKAGGSVFCMKQMFW